MMSSLPSSPDAPETPPRQRKFGTILSLNNTPPRSSTKKAIVRRRWPLIKSIPSVAAALSKEEEEEQQQQEEDNHQVVVSSQPSPSKSSSSTYTIVFEPGPIGLKLEPGGVLDDDNNNGSGLQHTSSTASSSGCLVMVQHVVPESVAALQQTHPIQPGDCITKVNGRAVTSYEQAVAWLKNANETRRIEFIRVVQKKGKSGGCNNNHNSNSTSSKAKAKRMILPHGFPGGIVKRRTMMIDPLCLSPRSVHSNKNDREEDSDEESSTSSILTFETTDKRQQKQQPPPMQRATPPPLRSRSMDPPPSSSRNNSRRSLLSTTTTTLVDLTKMSGSRTSTSCSPTNSRLFSPPPSASVAPTPPASSSLSSSASASLLSLTSKAAAKTMQVTATTPRGRERDSGTSFSVISSKVHSSTSSKDPPLLPLGPPLSSVKRGGGDGGVTTRTSSSTLSTSPLAPETKHQASLVFARDPPPSHLYPPQQQSPPQLVTKIRSKTSLSVTQQQQKQGEVEEAPKAAASVVSLPATSTTAHYPKPPIAPTPSPQSSSPKESRTVVTVTNNKDEVELPKDAPVTLPVTPTTTHHQKPPIASTPPQSFFSPEESQKGTVKNKNGDKDQEWLQDRMELHRSRREVVALRQETRQLTLEKHQLEAQLRTSTSTTTTNSSTSSREQELRAVQDELRQSQQELSRARAEQTVLELLVSQQQRHLEAADAASSRQTQTNLQTIQQQEQQMQLLLVSTRSEKEQLHSQVNNLRQEFELQKHQTGQAQARHERELETTRLEKKRLQAELDDLLQSKSATTTIDDDKNRGSSEEEALQVVMEMAQLRQRIASLQFTVDDLTSQLASKESTMQAAAVASNQEMQATKSNYASDVNRLTTIVDSMAEEKLRLQSKLYAAQDKLGQTTEQHSAQVKALETNNSKLQDQLRSIGLELETAQDKFMTLERQKQQLEKQMNRELQRVSIENETKVRALQQAQLQSLSESQARVDALMLAKQQESDKVKSQLVHANEQRHDLEVQLQAAKRELESTRDKLNETEYSHREFVLREKQKTLELEDQITSKFNEATVVSNAKLAEANAENSELQRQVLSLETSKRSLLRQIESLSTANKAKGSHIDELQQSLEDRDGKLSTQMVENAKILNALEDVRGELSLKSEELISSQAALEQVQAGCSQLTRNFSQAMEESSKEMESLMGKLETLQEELDITNARRSDMDKLVRSMRHNASESESRYAQARELLERERETVQRVKQAADASRKELGDQLTTACAQITDLESAIRKLELENGDIHDHSVHLEKQIKALKKELVAANESSQAAAKELAIEKEHLLCALSSEQAKGNELSDKLRLVDARLEEQHRETEFIKRRLEEKIRLASTEAESKMRMHDEVLRAKEAELQSLSAVQEELSDARSEITRLNAALRRAKGETEQLSNEIDALRQEQAAKSDQMLASYRRDLERLSLEKQDVERLLRKTEERKESVETRLYSAEEGLVAARSERERLISEKHDLLSSLHRAEDTIVELRDDLQALQSNSVCSSEDGGSENNEFNGMAKSDLKVKCVELQQELHSLRTQVQNSISLEALRSEQVQRLQEDLNDMSSEIDMLVKTNEMFESRLSDARTAKEEAITAEMKARSQMNAAEDNARDLKRQLVEQSQRNETITDTLEASEKNRSTEANEFAAQAEAYKNRISDLTARLDAVESEQRKVEDELARTQTELMASRGEAKNLRDKISTLESQLSYAKDQLHSALQESDFRQLEKDGEVGRHEAQISCLEDECSALRGKVAELEVTLETSRVELQGRIENETELSATLEKHRQELLEKDAIREDVVAKLAQASRVVASQKESMITLEHRASDAERTSSSLSSQIRHLQETIKKLESSTETHADLRVKQIQEFEEKCSLLEKERDELRAETNTLREDLRQTRRFSAETEKLSSSVQARVTSTKESLDKTKQELSEARLALEESASLSRRLEGEVENKRMENDHFKAKVQLLNANIARLKSDLLLYKEAALQAEFRLAGSDSAFSEVERLQSELKAKTSKLESLSEVYRSQQKVLGLSQTLEEQLIKFIEDLIRQVDDAFGMVSSRRSGTDVINMRVERKLELRALDLAGLERFSRASSHGSQHGRSSLHGIIQTVLSNLEAKRTQLCDWKKQRSYRILSIVSTPEAKPKSTVPDTPSVLETLKNVKRVLNNHLSPVKTHGGGVGRLDVEYFHKVIHALEHQIDGLLDDLRTANDALQAKDQLFADLENLVSHYEWERDRLEKKLESQGERVRDLDDKLVRQASWKRAAEKELAGVKEQLKAQQKSSTTSTTIDSTNTASAKRAAGRLIANFVESRSHARVASALRHWACQTSASHAVEHQQHVSTELARQLESTRHILSQLKQQHAKRRRGEPSLDRIVEGYETT